MAEGLEPATDALAHWAHWVTPASRSKRFDTHFFLAAAPPDQLAVHDGLESVESMAAARAAKVVRVQPEMVRSGEGWRIRIPAEADYGGELFETLDAPAI